MSRRRFLALLCALPLGGALLAVALMTAAKPEPDPGGGWAETGRDLSPAGMEDPLLATKLAEQADAPWVLSGRGGTILEPGEGLADEGGVRSGWYFDTDRVTTQTVRALTDELGIVFRDCGAGTSCELGDGTDVLTVGGDPLALLSVYRGTRAPQPCRSGESGCRNGYPDDLPTPEEVSRDARRVLTIAGLDPADFTWQVFREGHTVRGIASLRLDGSPVPLRWILDYSSEGVYSINGFLAAPVEMPGYRIVGARTAALRSSDARWAGLGAVPARQATDTPIPAGTDGVRFGDLVETVLQPRSEVPARFDGLPLLDPGTETVKVDTATLTLFLYRGVDGRPLLLPSWLLRAANGDAWYAPAVADAYVRLPRS